MKKRKVKCEEQKQSFAATKELKKENNNRVADIGSKEKKCQIFLVLFFFIFDFFHFFFSFSYFLLFPLLKGE